MKNEPTNAHIPHVRLESTRLESHVKLITNALELQNSAMFLIPKQSKACVDSTILLGNSKMCMVVPNFAWAFVNHWTRATSHIHGGCWKDKVSSSRPSSPGFTSKDATQHIPLVYTTAYSVIGWNPHTHIHTCIPFWCRAREVFGA